MAKGDNRFDEDFNDYPRIDLGMLIKNIKKAKNDPDFNKNIYARHGVEILKGEGEEYFQNSYAHKKIEIRKDPSFWFLLASNLIAIFFINKNDVPAGEIMIIFWIQTFIIGLLNVARIGALKSFYSDKIKINGEIPSKPRMLVKLLLALIFAVPYYFYHFIFLALIAGLYFNDLGAIGWDGVIKISSILIVNHLFSFFYNFKEETGRKNILEVLLGPFARILPMHMMVFAGSWLVLAGFPIIALNLFLFLKMALDLFAHAFLHRKTYS